MKLTAEAAKQLVKMYNEGVPNAEISKHLGISASSIQRYVHAHRDICPKKPFVKKSKINHKKLMELMNQGVTNKEIAKILNTSKSNLYKYMNSRRVPRVRKIFLKIDHSCFVILWNSGVKVETIAKIFYVSTVTVRNYAKEHANECPIREYKINREMFVKLWNEGVPCSAIAKHLGISINSVISYAGRHRKECPSRRRYTSSH